MSASEDDFTKYRVEADINPFDFYLGSPKGTIEIGGGTVAVAASDPKTLGVKLPRRRAVELRSTECRPVRVRLHRFVVVRSKVGPGRLTFRPHDEPIANCLAALKREGFTIDPKADGTAP